MPGIVYLLCAATSLACGLLSLRGYRALQVNLLFWTALCFIGLTVDNLFLYLDFIVVPETDLSIVRSLVGLASLLLLVYGLVWDTN